MSPHLHSFCLYLLFTVPYIKQRYFPLLAYNLRVLIRITSLSRLNIILSGLGFVLGNNKDKWGSLPPSSLPKSVIVQIFSQKWVLRRAWGDKRRCVILMGHNREEGERGINYYCTACRTTPSQLPV